VTVSILAIAGGIALLSAVSVLVLSGSRSIPTVATVPGLACVLAAAGLIVVVARPVPIASIVVATGLVGAIPLFTFAAASPRNQGGRPGPRSYPVSWWSAFYAATVIPLGLLATLLASPFMPPRLGSPAGRVEVIVAIAVVLLTLLPAVVLGHGRRALLCGLIGTAAALGLVGVAYQTELLGHPELALSSGWLLGMGILSLSTVRATRLPTDEPGIEAWSTFGIAMRMSAITFALGIGILIDWVVRRPA
jgi:hypothetical protein